jgi:predicted ABC-type ATPase
VSARSQPPALVAVAGPNGAGKSTAGPWLLKEALGIVRFVNADVIAEGLSAYAPETVALEAGRIMLGRLRELAERGETFAFETTLAGRAYVHLIRNAVDAGYGFDLLYLWLASPELAVSRVEDRVRRGGHAIPEQTVRRRYHRGLRNFFELYRPLSRRWRVYDNSSFGPPVLIASGSGSEVRRVEDSATWTRIKECDR